MTDDLPVIPITEFINTTAVSNKVKNYEVSLKGANPMYQWSVEEKKIIAHKWRKGMMTHCLFPFLYY